MFFQRMLSEGHAALRRQSLDFFMHEKFEEKYTQRINAALIDQRNRIDIDIPDLLDYVPPAAGNAENRTLGDEVLQHPNDTIPMLELALTELATRRNRGDSSKTKAVDGTDMATARRMRVGLKNPTVVLSPRELKSGATTRVVAVAGIVTRVGHPRCRVLETVHYSAATGRFTRRLYRDNLSPSIDNENLPSVNVMPRRDPTGNVLRTEFGLSTFQDVQGFTLQESPENTPAGQLPRSVEVRVEDDLVDAIKSGDRVFVVGVFQPFVKQTGPKKDFDAVLVANHITLQNRERSHPSISEEEEKRIQELSEKQDILSILAESIAPSIHGRVMEKKGIVLMLAGGVERHVKETHIRGDINVLLVGEPATAKSQLMRFVYQLAPNVIHTTGKGSTGVGLTAAVVTDPDTKERALCAGAMVLADRGVLLIDEFDKMSTKDRVAMHEAMEQQTITIAKAGIHATINARCSVLAAANPMFGYYSTDYTLGANLGLPESLLSRFDLIHLILDSRSAQHTRSLSLHVLKNHMTATPLSEDRSYTSHSVALASMNQRSEQGGSSNPWGKKNLVSVRFLRKYLATVRLVQPVLATSAVAVIAELYADLRREQSSMKDKRDALHVSPRTLEGLIRLATAHAKLRLSTVVEINDVTVAHALVHSSVFATLGARRDRDTEVDGDQDRANRDGNQGNNNSTGVNPTHPNETGVPHSVSSEDRFNSDAKPEGVTPRGTVSTITPITPHPTASGSHNNNLNLMYEVMQAMQTLHSETHRIQFSLHEIHAHVRHHGVGVDQVFGVLSYAHEMGSVIYTPSDMGDTYTLLQ